MVSLGIKFEVDNNIGIIIIIFEQTTAGTPEKMIIITILREKHTFAHLQIWLQNLPHIILKCFYVLYLCTYTIMTLLCGGRMSIDDYINFKRLPT